MLAELATASWIRSWRGDLHVFLPRLLRRSAARSAGRVQEQYSLR